MHFAFNLLHYMSVETLCLGYECTTSAHLMMINDAGLFASKVPLKTFPSSIMLLERYQEDIGFSRTHGQSTSQLCLQYF